MGTETNLSYDAGFYRRLGKAFDARITANYTKIRNYFVTNTSSIYYSGSFAYQIDTMKFYGVECEFNWTPSEKLTLFGNYSYLKNEFSKDEDLPDAILLELPPRNKGKLSIRYSLPADMRLASDIKFIGERKSEGGYALDRYATVNFSLEKKIAGKFAVRAFINNLFDAEYEQVYGYPSPHRTYGIRLYVSPGTNPFSQ